MQLLRGDPRLGVPKAPRCALCAEYMVPVHPDVVPEQPS